MRFAVDVQVMDLQGCSFPICFRNRFIVFSGFQHAQLDDLKVIFLLQSRHLAVNIIQVLQLNSGLF